MSSVISQPDVIGSFSAARYGPALFQLGNTLLLYFVAIFLMFLFVNESYVLVLALSIVAAVAHVRLFMIGHDCAHRSYLPERWQNIAIGNLIGVLVNTPLHYWGRQHAMHHGTTGNLDKRGAGDVVTWTVEEYLAAPCHKQILYRMHRNPWILMFVFAPVHFILMQRFPFEQRPASWKTWRSVMGTNIGMLVYYSTLTAAFSAQSVLLVYTPVILISSTAAVWLFYIQHQFDGAYWERENNWDYQTATLKGSSFYDLPSWLHWVTGNIGYHHIHHLNPRIPNYRLAACHKAVSSNLPTNPVRFRESLRMAKLALWNESTARLISFRDLGQAVS